MWDYKTKSISKESVIVYDSVTNKTAGILTRYVHDVADDIFVFTPNWDFNFTPNHIIAGYNLDLHLDEYVREGYPCFMSEFMPPKCREDSYELMLSVGIDMDYEMWAFMIEQGRICMDNWRVRRIEGEVYSHDKYKIK